MAPGVPPRTPKSPHGAARGSRPRRLSPATPAENAAIGALIKTFRTRQRLSQHAFAAAIGILPSALSRFERGTQLVPAALLFRIATAFHLPVTALLSPTPDPALYLAPHQQAALALLVHALTTPPPPDPA